MRREPTVPTPDSRPPHRSQASGKTSIWSVTSGDADYPRRLAEHPRARDWPVLYALGNREILDRQCLGLICSVKCPGSVVIKTIDAIRKLRDAGIVVAGGFHSPMEQECLDFLLRGDQPIIICPARHPSTHRLAPAWRSALNTNRLLIVSPFGPETRRPTQSLALDRNEFVAALSFTVLIPYASPGGKAENAALKIFRGGKSLFTFEGDPSEDGSPAPGRQFNLTEILKLNPRDVA